MQECIVITSGKGGVGKSTVSTNLASTLAHKGHKVALLDADTGLRNLDLLLGIEQSVQWDIVQSIQGECSLTDTFVSVPSTPNLTLIPTSQTRDKYAIVPDDMVQIVDRLFEEEGFEYVLIDCPAGIERGFETAVAAAHRAIVVVTPDVSSIRDADRVIDLLQKKRFSDIQVLINRYQPQLVQQGMMLDAQDIWQILETPVVAVVPESLDVLVASNHGRPVALNENSVLSEIFIRMVARLQGEEASFIDFNKNFDETVWSKMKKWAKHHMGA